MNQVVIRPKAPATNGKTKRGGMYVRFKPDFIRCIRASSKRKKMKIVDFLQCCVALHGKDARAGLLFKYEENKEFVK